VRNTNLGRQLYEVLLSVIEMSTNARHSMAPPWARPFGSPGDHLPAARGEIMSSPINNFGLMAGLGVTADVGAVALLAFSESRASILGLGIGAATAGLISVFTVMDAGRSGSWKRRIAAALALIIIGAGASGAALALGLSHESSRGHVFYDGPQPSSSSASPSPSASQLPPSVAGPTPQVGKACGTATIANPRRNDRVDRNTPVGGTATLCERRELWTLSAVDGQYYVRPRDDLDVTNGEWRDPFGAIIPSKYVNPQKLMLMIVETDEYGSENIRTLINQEQHYYGVQLKELTNSHMFILDSVAVINAEYPG
jgi:hypothetical protein